MSIQSVKAFHQIYRCFYSLTFLNKHMATASNFSSFIQYRKNLHRRIRNLFRVDIFRVWTGKSNQTKKTLSAFVPDCGINLNKSFKFKYLFKEVNKRYNHVSVKVIIITISQKTYIYSIHIVLSIYINLEKTNPQTYCIEIVFMGHNLNLMTIPMIFLHATGYISYTVFGLSVRKVSACASSSSGI